MSQQDITIMIIAFLIVAFIINSMINKLTTKIQAQDDSPGLFLYTKFCDTIDEKISFLKDLIKNGKINANSNEDNCLEELSNFSKQLVFIQSMHITNKNVSVWEEKLSIFLMKLDKFILDNFQDGQKISDEVRNELLAEFNKIKKTIQS